MPAFLDGLASLPQIGATLASSIPQLLESCFLFWAQLLLVCGAWVVLETFLCLLWDQ